MKSGLLGDTLVAVPALHCLRAAYPKASITYVWQRTGMAGHVTVPDVLGGSGLVDRFYCYDLRGEGPAKALRYAKLWLHCAMRRYDLGVILEASYWSGRRRAFFQSAGVKRVVSPAGGEEPIRRDKTGNVFRVPRLADELIGLLRPLAIDLPAPGAGRADINLTESDREAAKAWIVRNGGNPERSLFMAVGPGSNMPAKRWPAENYARVLRQLVVSRGVVPVVFGGEADRDLGRDLLSHAGVGMNAAGELSVRQGIAVMGLCSLFLGNDTGVMHMAAAAGTRCVALFSSIDMPGRWEPYGPGHIVFREEIECAGCLLRECDMGAKACINRIPPDAVRRACETILDNARPGQPANKRTD